MNSVRVLRRAGWFVLVVLVVLACLAGTGAYFAIRASLPDYRATVRIPGLSQTVTVYRDAHGVPQVYADNATDLFRAEGYLQATDRFWEMDFRRHVTAGRLSELFGAAQVKTDEYIRTMGWRRVAQQEVALLTPETRQWLEAYSAGVNAWITTHSGVSASLEYGILRLQNPHYTVEPWTPVDSLSWLKAMAWDLRSNMTNELARARLLAAGFDTTQIRTLYPDYPYAEHPSILSSGALVNGTFQPSVATPKAAGGAGSAPTAPTAPTAAIGATATGATATGATATGATADGAAARGVLSGMTGQLASMSTVLREVSQVLGIDGDGIGSNSFVVSGAHTTTGKPILENDPHLGPAMPSVWYQIGLHCTAVSAACPFDVVGFSFAGVPGVVIGHNARVAWGFTNLAADVTDLFLERVKGDNYERDGVLVPLVKRTERIKVAGGKDVVFTARSTLHGPLLSDQDTQLAAIGAKPGVDSSGVPLNRAGTASPAYAVALEWTALTPGRTADALFALDKAGNFADFRAAAQLVSAPAQNMVYADVDGNIGYQAPGTIPVRGSGDGLYPAPGWNSTYDWVGTVPFGQLPYVENPASGYLVTANQAPTVQGAGPVLGYDFDYGYRSSRIADLLKAAPGPVDVAGLSALAMDAWSGIAPALVPALVGLKPAAGGTTTGRLKAAQTLLARWDYQESENSAAAAYFNAVWRHLLSRTFDELPAGLSPDGGSRWFEVMTGLLQTPDSPWWDDKRTARVEHRDDILHAAMGDALAELTQRLGTDESKWRWGDLHTLTIRNQSLGMSGVGPVEWLFNRGPYPVGGGTSIVDATGWEPADGYQVTWVPSMRMIVDLADPDRSRWINLTGESGHAFSDYYTDQTELWQTGRTTPMRCRPATIRAEAQYVQKMRP